MAAFACNTLPDGWLACDGTAVSRTTYANLFSKIGTTYGSGDGSTTFSLPNLTDKFIQGNGTPGTIKNAGLPNITGFVRTSNAPIGADNPGAFYVVNETWTVKNAQSASTDAAPYQSASFSASRSNSIYGSSNTVQPPALTMRFAIFAGHSTLFRWIRTAHGLRLLPESLDIDPNPLGNFIRFFMRSSP